MSKLSIARIAGLDLPISRLFFGTAVAPIWADEPAAPVLLDNVLKAGVNAFDCARSYGYAEKVLGRWMESRGCRDRVIVLTKCGDIQDGVVHIDRRVILDQLSRSLEALQIEQIDIYLLHRDDPNTPVEEMIDTMNEAKEAGKFRIFGASNWTRDRIEKANHYAKSRGLAGFTVSSPSFSLAHPLCDMFGGDCITLSGQEHAADRAWYASSQMPVIAYSSLGRGFFSGRFKAGDYEKARTILDIYAQKGYLHEENMERLRRAELLAKRLGTSVSEVAMRYVFSSPMNIFAVVSTTSPDRIRMNQRAVSCPLTPEEVTFLENRLEEGDETS